MTPTCTTKPVRMIISAMKKLYLEDDWYRQTLQSQGVTVEKIEEWDRLADGQKREHVATAAERKHWLKNVFLEADDSKWSHRQAPPNLQKAQEWHREHVLQQRYNTPTQQQKPICKWD